MELVVGLLLLVLLEWRREYSQYIEDLRETDPVMAEAHHQNFRRTPWYFFLILVTFFILTTFGPVWWQASLGTGLYLVWRLIVSYDARQKIRSLGVNPWTLRPLRF